MKKLIALSLLAATAISGCTKLDVNVKSQYVSSNFPVTAADYNAVMGPLYTQLSSRYAIEYFRMQELTTDELILPGRDGNYDDGGQYRQHHHHTYTKDHPNVKDVWEWGFGGINSCNRIMNLLMGAPSSEEAKQAGIAKVRAMRALFYFFMMDLYGNVPIIDKFPVDIQPTNSPRAEVFAFIEQDLIQSLPFLPAKTDGTATSTYGQPTKGMAHALLAKMYLNSEVYTGKKRYSEAVAFCDSVISNTSYKLDASYASVFDYKNGPSVTESIFAVPYDALQIPGQQFTRHGMMAYLYRKYSVPSNLSISYSTTPDFYDRFNLAGDERTTTWLIGKQYYFNGAPYTIPLKTKDLDANYPGANTDTLWQMEITKPIVMTGKKPFDVGNDYKARCMGVRSVKYYPDPTTTAQTRMSSNDMYVFRLADIYLMKAEAILRGAEATIVNGEAQTPLVLLNKVRARAKAAIASSIDLDILLDERARELYWENWRRNDLIRFGKYEVEYPVPGDVAVPGYTPGMDKSPDRRIFPIPASEIRLTPFLVQNPGYN